MLKICLLFVIIELQNVYYMPKRHTNALTDDELRNSLCPTQKTFFSGSELRAIIRKLFSGLHMQVDKPLNLLCPRITSRL